MLELLAASLAHHQEPFPSDSKKHRGAVGVLIKEEADDLWLLMIQRRENPQDPWSGQMAFPGGHADARDRTLLDTVIREAIEEVGVDVRDHKLLGCLPNVHPRNAPMVVAPFIFLLAGEVRPVTSREAKEVLWVPMTFLLDSKNITSSMFTIDDEEITMPCYKYLDHIIWGMSFRIIRDIIQTITRER